MSGSTLPSTKIVFGDLKASDRTLKNAYRYTLYRDMGGHLPDMFETAQPLTCYPSVCFLMYNPSTADAHKDDPTIRRCRGYARRWGAKELYIVNLFAYRTPDPVELLALWHLGLDVVGPDNDRYIKDLVAKASVTVAAWGSVYPVLEWRIREVRDLIEPYSEKVMALGFTQKGQPRHPLYVKKDVELTPLNLNHSDL